MRAYLEQAGYEVLIAHDGETALHTLRREKPDLVLLDLMLPDRDGWEITRIMRGDPGLVNTPIIMLIKGSTTYHPVKNMISPAEIAPTEPRVSATTCRKAPLTFRLSCLDLDRLTAANPLATRPKTAMTSMFRLSTSAGS